MKLEALDSHPSVYICPRTKLLVVVYVDDILVAGPTCHQQEFWDTLKTLVELEDVKQFLHYS